MSIFKLSEWVVNSIDRIRRDFFWRCPDIDMPKCHLVNWKWLCQPREQGDWGIINLEEFNNTLLRKWWWKIMHDTSWCSSSVIQFNYFHNNMTWNLFINKQQRSSYFWQDIQDLLVAYRNCLLNYWGWPNYAFLVGQLVERPDPNESLAWNVFDSWVLYWNNKGLNGLFHVF